MRVLIGSESSRAIIIVKQKLFECLKREQTNFSRIYGQLNYNSLLQERAIKSKTNKSRTVQCYKKAVSVGGIQTAVFPWFLHCCIPHTVLRLTYRSPIELYHRTI